jgi:hypothetical protein
MDTVKVKKFLDFYLITENRYIVHSFTLVCNNVYVYTCSQSKHFSTEGPADLTPLSRLYMDGDTQHSYIEYFFLA